MIERCAAKINDDGIVLELIVGEADWAIENLGGSWIQCERDYDDLENDGCPNVGDKWDAKKGIFISSNNLVEQIAKIESAKAKLATLGLSDEEIKALLG